MYFLLTWNRPSPTPISLPHRDHCARRIRIWIWSYPGRRTTPIGYHCRHTDPSCPTGLGRVANRASTLCGRSENPADVWKLKSSVRVIRNVIISIIAAGYSLRSRTKILETGSHHLLHHHRRQVRSNRCSYWKPTRTTDRTWACPLWVYGDPRLGSPNSTKWSSAKKFHRCFMILWCMYTVCLGLRV